MNTHRAYIKHEGGWWIGYVYGIRGVNAQERTKLELIESLKELIPVMIELNLNPFYYPPDKDFSPITIKSVD